MLLEHLALPLLLILSAISQSDATTEFENPWVRVVRVHYSPLEKTAVHDHPPTPTVYVYVTDGGRLRLSHDGEEPVLRPPVKAGGIRFQRGVSERHAVKEMDGIESQYLRIELKTRPVDLPVEDVRRAPGDRTPYESGMIRILRVTCAARRRLPGIGSSGKSGGCGHGSRFEWAPAGTAASRNTSDAPAEQVRVGTEDAAAALAVPYSLVFNFDRFSSMNDLISPAIPRSLVHCS